MGQKTGKQFFYDSQLVPLNSSFISKNTGKAIHFPNDHGRHNRSVTEWWYFNGHLTDSLGNNYGYEFCLFRRFPLVYFAHISITDETGQVFTFVRKFYPFFKVKLARQTATISYGKKQIIEQISDSIFRIKGELNDIKLDLLLEMKKTPLIINGNGKIRMEGGKSFYYSLTRLKTNGSINREGKSMQVTGISWMDHQWGNFRVIKKNWDWFSFQMEDGTDYNLYLFRNKRHKPLKQYANILDEKNKTIFPKQIIISRNGLWQNQKTRHWYATDWEIILPDQRDTFLVAAKMKNQELFSINKFDFFPSYWEGACSVIKKTANGKAVRGLGFAEQFPFRKNKIK